MDAEPAKQPKDYEEMDIEELRGTAELRNIDVEQTKTALIRALRDADAGGDEKMMPDGEKEALKAGAVAGGNVDLVNHKSRRSRVDRRRSNAENTTRLISPTGTGAQSALRRRQQKEGT